MTPVSISPRAQADLVQIQDYLAVSAGLQVADRYVRDIRAQIRSLRDFPGFGTLKPIFGKRVRMLVENPYLIFHDFSGLRVEVLRILDGRRRITRKLVVEGRD